jgi:hypothetical protein
VEEFVGYLFEERDSAVALVFEMLHSGQFDSIQLSGIDLMAVRMSSV